ncbi:MAG: hypothetical protein COC01_03705 [Bacteroidetes bacterium]|nr:MAG: hypothetical protein COC01_03705 [Bacteroidota bacterium]
MYSRIIISALLLLVFTATVTFSQTANFIPDKTKGCASFNVNFTNFSIGATTYFWDFDDGFTSVDMHPQHTFYSAGTDYNVMLVAFDAALNSDTFYTVISVPAGLPYFNVPASTCPGEYISFAVYGNYDSDNDILWDFGDGLSSSEKYPYHAYSTTGKYTAILTVINENCGTVYDTNAVNISGTIIPPIHIHSYGTGDTICPGENFPYFYDEDMQIKWEFGDSTFSTDPYPIHSYDSSGNYNVIITVTNECGNTNSLDTLLTVDSNDFPQAYIDISTLNYCPGEVFTFTGKNGFGWIYEWTFEGSNIFNSRVTNYSFSDTGNYEVQLVVSNQCGKYDTAYSTVSIVDTGEIYGGIYINPKNACPGHDITFLVPQDGYSYIWDFGNGDSSLERSTKYQYTEYGTYVISLLISNACGESLELTDTVVIDSSSSPTSDFLVSQSKFCPGDLVYFTSNSSGDARQFYWDFGDGTSDTSKNPVHTYADSGAFSAFLITTNSCNNKDTITKVINIDNDAPVNASFYNNQYNKICPGTAVEFVNLSSDTSNCIWYFGDGDSSFSANPIHKFEIGGNYLVSLTVKNNCGSNSTIIDLVRITQSSDVYADLILNYNDSICLGEEVQYINSSDNFSSSFWNFGDGQTSSDSIAYHIYTNEGNYTVRLTIESTCGSAVDSTEIEINPLDTLNAPNVSCTSDTNYILFRWTEVPDADNYVISTDTSTSWENPNGNLEHLISGLSPGDTVQFYIKAIDSNICTFEMVSQEILCSTTPLSISNSRFEKTFQLYPNPVDKYLKVNWAVARNQPTNIYLTDIIGRHRYNFKPNPGTSELSINVEKYESGIYIMGIQKGNNLLLKKVSIVHY